MKFVKFIQNKKREVFFLISALITILFFQNCGQSGFQSRLPSSLEQATGSQNDQLDLPSEDPVNDELAGIIDVPNIPQNNGVNASSSSESIATGSSVNLTSMTTTGKTYYVSTSGSNSNPGTSSLPFRNIAYAVSKMVAGDTTYVRGGVYKESLIRFGKSGTKSAPIKLLSVSGQNPVIDCIDYKQGHRILIQNEAGYKYPMGYITIEGFEIKNCYNGIKVYNANDLIVRRNWIHDSYGSGIQGNGTRILVDRNRITRNALLQTSAPWGHGIYMNGKAITFTNNLFYNNLAFGLQQNGSSSSSYKPDFHPSSDYALSSNWIVANNTFAYQIKGAGMVVWGSTCNNIQISNNIFYENGVTSASSSTQGISFVSTACKGITIRNNLAYASGTGATRFLGSGATEGVHYTKSGNIEGLNPRFANAPASMPSLPNFALTSLSPAIDKGLNLTSILSTLTSFNGVTRPRGLRYDIGAYEY